MATIGTLTARINADTSDLKKNLRNAESQITRFSSNVQKQMKSIMKISGVVFGAMTAIIGTSIKATTHHENAMAKLESAIIGTGKAIDSLALEKYAEHLQDVSMFSNEANIESMAMLTTFQMTEQEIRNLMPRVQNIASMYKMDLVQASQQVGRALTMGAGALSRYGIVMSEAEKVAFNLANQQEKINILMSVFDKNTGPAAARMANTLTGQWRMMRNEIDDLRKEIGRLFDDDALNMLHTARSAVRIIIDRIKNLDTETARTIRNVVLFGTALAGIVMAGALGIIMLATLIKSLAVLVGVLAIVKSPIFLLMLAVGALWLAWKNDWGNIRTYTKNTWNNFIKPAIDNILSKLQNLKQWFSESKVGQSVKDFWVNFRAVWAEESTISEKLIESLKLAADLAIDISKIFWNWAGEKYTNIINLIKALFDKDIDVGEVEFGVGEIVFALMAATATIKLLTITGVTAWAVKAAAVTGLGGAITTAIGKLAAGGLLLGKISIAGLTLSLLAGAIGWIFGDKEGREGFMSAIQESIGKMTLEDPFTIPLELIKISMKAFDFGTEGLKNIRASLQAASKKLQELEFEEGEGFQGKLNLIVESMPENIQELGSNLYALGISLSEFLGEGFKMALDFSFLLMDVFDASVLAAYSHFKVKAQELGKAIIEGIKDVFPNWLINLFEGETTAKNTIELINPTGMYIPSLHGTGENKTGGHVPGLQSGGLTANVGVSQPAGVVHGGEWVMPAWMVDKFPKLTGMLEGMRQRKGYQQGGPVGFQPGGNVPGLEAAQETLDFATMSFDNIFNVIVNLFQGIMGKMMDMAEKHLDADILEGIRSFVNDVNKELEKLKGGIKGSNLGGEFSSISAVLWNAAKNLIPSWDSVKETFQSGLETFKGIFTDAEVRLRLFNAIIPKIGGSLSHLGGMFMGLITKVPGLNSVINAFQAAPDPITGMVAALISLLAETEGFQEILSFAADAFGFLVTTLEPVAVALMPVFEKILVAVITILEPSIPILVAFVKVIDWAAGLIIKIWNGIMRALSTLLDWIPGINFEGLIIEVDKTKTEIEEFGKSANKANKAMMNIPHGIKVAQRAFEVATPRTSIGDFPVSIIFDTPVVSGEDIFQNIDLIRDDFDDNLITDIERFFRETGYETKVIIEGDIYGYEDFKRKVAQANNDISSKNMMSNLGLRGAI